MRIVLRDFDGCPNWRTTYARLREALEQVGDVGGVVLMERVGTQQDAERLHFVGSPSILLDDRDPFAGSNAGYGLTCRVYQTPEGLAGSPTIEQLVVAIADHKAGRVEIVNPPDPAM